MAPNIFPIYYKVLFMYLEPIIFSIGNAATLIKDPRSFQADHAPGHAAQALASTSPFLLSNQVVLYEYASLLVVAGLMSFFAMRTTLKMTDPTGRSQEAVIRAVQLAFLAGDTCFTAATVVPYVRAGYGDMLNPFKLLTGQAEFVMIPFLNVYVTLALVLARMAWLGGVGRERALVDVKKSA